jgi:hypothetical protein
MAWVFGGRIGLAEPFGSLRSEMIPDTFGKVLICLVLRPNLNRWVHYVATPHHHSAGSVTVGWLWSHSLLTRQLVASLLGWVRLRRSCLCKKMQKIPFLLLFFWQPRRVVQMCSVLRLGVPKNTARFQAIQSDAY